MTIEACLDTKPGLMLEGHALSGTSLPLPPLEIVTHFVCGPRVELLGPSERGDERFLVEFIDESGNEVHFSTHIGIGEWCQANRQYHTDWRIRVSSLETGSIEAEERYEPESKRVYIAFESKALGDTIAWMGYVEAYRQHVGCHVVCSTFWNRLFEEQYSDIEFIEPGATAENIYAMFKLGVFTESASDRHPRSPRGIPLQSVASDILGLTVPEIRPKLSLTQGTNPLVKPYICIAEHATAKAKYWNRDQGWQELVDYLNEAGVTTVVVSKEPTELNNIVDRTGSSIEETIALVRDANCFVGLSSGLSWLAWALDTPVVMISGFTEGWYEFSTNTIRLVPRDGCYGCFNHMDSEFDKSDWNWCPRLKDTPRQFECSRSITSGEVIQAVARFIKPTMRNIGYLNVG